MSNCSSVSWSKVSVIISVSIPSSSSSSELLEHCEFWSSWSVSSSPSASDFSSGSLWSDSVPSNRLVQAWQLHLGPQCRPVLRHPHHFVLQPFLQEQPFVRNCFVPFTCSCSSSPKMLGSGACLHISDTQHERSQWRHIDVCEGTRSSSFDILSLTVLLISEYQSLCLSTTDFAVSAVK